MQEEEKAVRKIKGPITDDTESDEDEESEESNEQHTWDKIGGAKSG